MEDTGADPGSLALLAFTLAELYRACQDKVLTLAAYEALGGVHGAIGRRAATGGDSENVYPWGREWGSGPANTSKSKLRRTTAERRLSCVRPRRLGCQLAPFCWMLARNGQTSTGGQHGSDALTTRLGSFFHSAR